jgi:ABC-type Fe3+-siderophore transport system permease subunit
MAHQRLWLDTLPFIFGDQSVENGACAIAEPTTMEWLTKNFVVVSAVVVLGAAAASVVFLIGYLSTFDWTLIWLVEYSDLTKLFLIFGALLSLVGAFILSFLNNLMEDVSLLNKVSAVGTIIAVVLIFLGIDVYHDFQAQNGLAFWHAMGAFCWVMFLFTIFLIFGAREQVN